MSYAVVKQAIGNKQPISAIYNNKLRLFCPHVLGHSKKGALQSLCYQFGGESSSRPIEPDGSSANWRCVELSKLSNVQIIDGPWHTAPVHTRPQTCVSQIDIEVTY